MTTTQITTERMKQTKQREGKVNQMSERTEKLKREHFYIYLKIEVKNVIIVIDGMKKKIRLPCIYWYICVKWIVV